VVDPVTENADPEQAPEQKTRQKNKLEGSAWRRHRLITELAKGEKTERTLASENGVAPSSINEFRQRHSDEIEERRAHLNEEFDGVWIAQKLNRLVEMEELYDSDIPNRERETRLAVLRAAAEELGQIPNRTTIDMATPVEVRINGADDV
jgi:hypothetical protein